MAVADYSLTPGSNTTISGININEGCPPSGINDALRQQMADTKREHAMTSLTSTATLSIGTAAAARIHVCTDAGKSISSFDTIAAGIERTLIFDVAATLVHDGTKLILHKAQSLSVVAGDVVQFVSEGSGNWRQVTPKVGAVVPGDFVLGTEIATTSGTTHSWTGIPSWAREIKVMFVGVSLSGTSDILIQLGDAGGAEATGYLSSSIDLADASAVVGTNSTTGFRVIGGAGTRVWHGCLHISMEDSSDNTWVAQGGFSRSEGAGSSIIRGSKATSAVLDRITIVSGNGSDTFDAGVANISYR